LTDDKQLVYDDFVFNFSTYWKHLTQEWKGGKRLYDL